MLRPRLPVVAGLYPCTLLTKTVLEREASTMIQRTPALDDLDRLCPLWLIESLALVALFLWCFPITASDKGYF